MEMHLARKTLSPRANNWQESAGRERSFANYHFLSMLINPGFSLIKLKK